MRDTVRKLQQVLRTQQVDVAIFGRPENVAYVTGIAPEGPEWAGVAMAGGPMTAVLFAETADSGELILANTEEWIVGQRELHVLRKLYPAFSNDHAYDPQKQYIDALTKEVNRLLSRSVRIGIDDGVPHMVVESLRRRGVDGLVNITEVAARCRRIKTPSEIALIRECARINDIGQQACRSFAKPGITELELWHHVVQRMEDEVGARLTVSGELVSGPRTAKPNYPGGPTTRILQPADTVILDLSVRLSGYWTDTTNTLVLSASPSTSLITCFSAAKAAFEAVIKELGPGQTCADVEKVARQTLSGFGFLPQHYLGHQIGTTVNELPRLVSYDSSPIEPGMVFAIEPGAYEGEGGSFGARLEKNIVVTETGCEILSNFPWGLDPASK